MSKAAKPLCLPISRSIHEPPTDATVKPIETTLIPQHELHVEHWSLPGAPWRNVRAL